MHPVTPDTNANKEQSQAEFNTFAKYDTYAHDITSNMKITIIWSYIIEKNTNYKAPICHKYAYLSNPQTPWVQYDVCCHTNVCAISLLANVNTVIQWSPLSIRRCIQLIKIFQIHVTNADL